MAHSESVHDLLAPAVPALHPILFDAVTLTRICSTHAVGRPLLALAAP